MNAMGFVPGLAFRSLTPAYDGLIRITMRERRFKTRLLEQIDFAGAQSIVDVGCGTGTLAIMLKRAAPYAQVVGVDIDADMLKRAREKVKKAGLDIAFELRHAAALPMADASVDLVVSTLAFHHLMDPEKRTALKEVRRVLRPGGAFHMVDFGKPSNLALAATCGLARRIDGRENTEANVRGRIPDMILAEFDRVQVRGHMNTVFGTLDFIRAT